MVIPKSFDDGRDFESMLLTSILGTFIALKEDLISLKQAESYWFSDLTAEIFEELSLSAEAFSSRNCPSTQRYTKNNWTSSLKPART